jgi:Skp family chaperone for outer membrane proteins
MICVDIQKQRLTFREALRNLTELVPGAKTKEEAEHFDEIQRAVVTSYLDTKERNEDLVIKVLVR